MVYHGFLFLSFSTHLELLQCNYTFLWGRDWRFDGAPCVSGEVIARWTPQGKDEIGVFCEKKHFDLASERSPVSWRERRRAADG